ncbi:MAG: hypothetical protein ABIR30_06130 [Chitinophagaceae bacterium]
MKNRLASAALFTITGFMFLQDSPAANQYTEQYLYHYQSENLGYSDITILYSSDSLDSKNPFFERKKLEITQFNINTQIRKTIYANGDSNTRVCFEILDPDISITNNDLVANSSMIREELQFPILATINNLGNITAIRMDPAVSYMSGNIIKDILSRFQFTSPEKRPVLWDNLEENTIGVFVAKYKLTQASNDKLEYEKTNEGFIEWDGMDKGQKINTDSKTIIRIDSSGSVEQVNVSEAQVILFATDTVVASGTKISIQLTSKHKNTDQENRSFEKKYLPLYYDNSSTLRVSLSDEQIKELSCKTTLGQDNLSVLLHELESFAAGKNKYKQQLVLKFRALAYLFPENCEKLATILTRSSFGSSEFKVISQALAVTATPAAINTIAMVMKERKNEENILLHFLPVCATSTSPTEKALEIVNEIASDRSRNAKIRSAAQLALGGMAFNFRHHDINKAESLTRYLLAKMETIQDTIQQILVLGNTGSPSVLPVLKHYIADTTASKEVRISGVAALRLIDGEEVNRFLIEMGSHNNGLLTMVINETLAFRKGFNKKTLR